MYVYIYIYILYIYIHINFLFQHSRRTITLAVTIPHPPSPIPSVFMLYFCSTTKPPSSQDRKGVPVARLTQIWPGGQTL